MTDTSATAELQSVVVSRSEAGRLRFILGLVFLIVVLAVLYFPTFKWLVTEIWWRDKEYSHGFLVPFIVAYLAWIRRSYLATLPVRPAPLAGSLLLFFSAALLFGGRAGSFRLAEGISFLFVLPGLVLFLWGWGHLKALVLPLAYVQFMVPWMEDFIERVHWPFQLLSAEIGVGILRVFGYPVFHSGKYITLPAITLEVARECSGLRFLMSIIALGIPLVYLTQRSWKRASAVIFSAIGIAIVANGLRVALAGMSATRYGEAMLHGPMHVFQGWFVSQVGIVVLFALDWFAARKKGDNRPKLYERAATHAEGHGEPWFRNLALALAFLGVFAFWLQFHAVTVPVPLKRSFAFFPGEIGGWRGGDSRWFPAEDAFPGAANELTRVYRNAEGKSVHLYVGYFDSQRAGKAMVNGRPTNPLRNSIMQSSLKLDSLTRDSLELGKVNVSFPVLGDAPYVAVYWYHFPSGAISGRYRSKLAGLMNAALHRHDNSAVIVIAEPLAKGADANAAVADLLTFARAASPVLRDYIP